MGLSEHFGRPLYLGLLVLVPLVYLIARSSLAGLPPLRRAASIGLRTLVVLLLVLAAAEMRLVRKNDRLAVIYAVDVSASIPPEHRDEALDFARRSSRERDPVRGDFVGLVVFGKNAGIEASPRAAPLEFEGLNTLIEKDFTDLEGAIRLASAAFPEGAARRLVLISDGNENRGRALEEARAAREQGVEIQVLPVSYRYPGEILVDKVVVDPESHVGEPFEVRVVVESTREARATLRLFENQAQVQAQEVTLRPGKNVFVVPRRLDLADLYTYEAMVEPFSRSDDAILQNNGATGFTFIRGEPRVLLCAPDPGQESALLTALKEERINVTAVRPEGLPGRIEEYLAYDAVLLSNVSAHQLTEERMKMLESLVKAIGLGFVMLGGEDSFGAGGYQATPVEEILPVYMEIKQKKVLPNGALGIVMHSSEIDNGNYWAKQTVQQAIRVLSPRDYAGVLYYDHMGGEKWLFPMTRVEKKQMMLSRLNNFIPGDMPDFSRIVQMAHTALKPIPASIKHIIILSDGDPNMPTGAQVQAIRQDGITISTICMGAHSNPANMRNLAAAGGGKFYELTDPQKLPSIFIREATTVRKSLLSERDFQPVVVSSGSFLRGIDLNSTPLLKGYVITSQKESADQALAAPPVEGDPTLDPLLSSWVYGLGKAVAFTSDAGRRWGVHWPAWGDYKKFWGQVVRWVSRESADQGLRATRTVEGESAALTIDAVDEAGNFMNGIAFEGAVVDPDFKSQPVETRQVAPGRYRQEFPVSRRGTYVVSLRYQKDGRTYSYSTGLSVPYSPEFRHLSTNEDLLRRIAGAAGGKVVDPSDPAAIFARDFPPARSSRDLWRPLLQAAAVLFFVDVFVRRVALDYRKLLLTALARAQAVLRRRRVELPADPRLSALLRKKSEVRATRTGERKFFEPGEAAAPPALDEAFIAGAGPPPGKPEPRPEHRVREAAPVAAPGPERAGKPAGEAESYTGRLLAAKKRALGKRETRE